MPRLLRAKSHACWVCTRFCALRNGARCSRKRMRARKIWQTARTVSLKSIRKTNSRSCKACKRPDISLGGRAIHQRVLTWIINKISRTTLKAGFVVVVFLVTGKFAISALAMILLVLMTDFVQITMATDRVDAPPEPQTWEITPFARVALALGGLMLIEA